MANPIKLSYVAAEAALEGIRGLFNSNPSYFEFQTSARADVATITCSSPAFEDIIVNESPATVSTAMRELPKEDSNTNAGTITRLVGYMTQGGDEIPLLEGTVGLSEAEPDIVMPNNVFSAGETLVMTGLILKVAYDSTTGGGIA